MDLLISSLRLTKMAKLEHPVFVPVIGNDPYDLANKSLMTAAECRDFLDEYLSMIFIIFYSLQCTLARKRSWLSCRFVPFLLR